MFKVIHESPAIDDEQVVCVVLSNGERRLDARVWPEDGAWWWKLETAPYWSGGNVHSIGAAIADMRNEVNRQVRAVRGIYHLGR